LAVGSRQEQSAGRKDHFPFDIFDLSFENRQLPISNW
jgi:hypothetical protein